MENEDSVAKKIQDKRTKIQQKKAVHEKNAKDRADKIADLKLAYQAERDGTVLQDILAKAKSFAAYHTKMAQDGVGARKTGYKLENGEAETETIYYTNEKRVSELDKASGILELVDYIERQVKVPAPINPEAQQAVDNAQAEAADVAPKPVEPAAESEDPSVTKTRTAPTKP